MGSMAITNNSVDFRAAIVDVTSCFDQTVVEMALSGMTNEEARALFARAVAIHAATNNGKARAAELLSSASTSDSLREFLSTGS